MKTTPWLIVVMIGSAGGFFWGTRVGVETHIYANAQYQAALLTIELGRLAKGEVNRLEELKEIDLDRELAYHYKYEHGIARWLWPELASPDNKEILFASKYRKNNPHQDPIFPTECPPACADSDKSFARQQADWQVEFTKLRDAVVGKYTQ